MTDTEHTGCRFREKACGPDCPVAIDQVNDRVRERIESVSAGGVSVVVEHADGSISFGPPAGTLPTGDLFRTRAAVQPANRRARRAEAARARHG